MIIFRYVRWKNLLSTGNYYTEINLYNNSNTLVVGALGARDPGVGDGQRGGAATS